jgi:hypothetical protein
VVTQIGPYPAINNQYTYAIVLDDQLIASGGGNHCSTPVQEGSLGARLLDRVLDVSGATAGRDATLRLLATSTEANTFGTVGAINITASAPADFAVTAVTPFDGDGPIETFRNGVKKGDKKIYKMIGIPDGSRATKNKWGLGASEDLHFTEPYTTTKGLITLNDVGFNQLGGARALWTTKSDEASLSVEVQAKMPDQTTVTKTAKLGVGGTLNTHAGWNLTPLYDAGLITGALRYPTNNREEAIGRDGWGILAAWEFLTAHNALRFNDLSLEVGGPWPPHGAHQVGTSIDIIYLGPGGLGNALNTNPATRLNRWQQAKNGDVDARREMVAWIRANRAAMDAIFTDNRVAKILVGNAKWNFNPIVYGTFADGTTQVTDPDDNDNPIGAWSVTKAQAEDGHLDHLHIELNTRSQGNSIP